DISVSMILKARKRAIGQNEVRFIHQSAADDFEGNDYNVILTPFFFDNFKEATMHSIFIKLHQKLQQNGRWFYADFQITGKSKLFQKGMLSIMYTFFRTICNIEGNYLPDVEARFATYKYKLISSKTFKKEFIISSVYEKA